MAAGIFVRSAAELQIGPASTAGSGVSVLRVTVDADSLDEAIAIAERAAGPGYGVEPD